MQVYESIPMLNRNDVQEAILRLSPWHYNHILPYGISTGDSLIEETHPKLVELLKAGAFPRPMYPRVLDLGANSGLISMWFVSNKNSHVTAIEGNKRYYQQLELAVELKGYSGKIKPVFGDITELGYGHNEFDLVLYLGTMHHLKPEHHLNTLIACHEALLPAGEIVVQTDNELPVEAMLKEVGFVLVKQLDTHWSDRAAWAAMKDPMKIW